MAASAPRPLTIPEISASIPGARGAARLSPSTITRWILDGCLARDGERVHLAAMRAGCRWLVYQSDLDTFFERLAAGTGVPAPAPTPARSTTSRRKRSEAAGRKLAAMGA